MDSPELQAAPGRGAWTWWQRAAFRFAFLFWTIFCITNGALNLVLWFWPWLERQAASLITRPIEKLSIWTVFHLSGVTLTHQVTGSGDTALAWTEFFCMLAIALLGCGVWSAISEARKRRQEYHTLYAWLRLAMRFSLAATLLAYGFDKVFPLQMPPPSATRLNETFGASSPMGLLWTFIGASATYRIFAGLAEVIPALLLLFRRTSTVGALLAAGTMLNVVLMNFAYDVPVKLYSGELLLMALFLLLPDILPLWTFLVRRRPAALTGVWVPRPERKALRIAGYCLQAIVIGYLLYGTGYGAMQLSQSSHNALAGNWAVDSRDGSLAAMDWQTFVVDSPYVLRAGPEGKPDWFPVHFVTKTSTVQFLGPYKDGHPGPQYAEMHWSTETAGRITLSGTWKGQPGSVTMHRVAAPVFPLTSRGFHWVQEFPYNR